MRSVGSQASRSADDDASSVCSPPAALPSSPAPERLGDEGAQRRRGPRGGIVNEPTGRAADPAYRTVLVPLDGSPRAAGALPTARALAARFDATVHTVTVT
ncbi:MAG: universal stress protein, partial [Solirubrobacteraceae bacterium]